MNSPFKLWRRWDPRLEHMPIREVNRRPRWLIEVTTDLFEHGRETLRDDTLRSIGALEYGQRGRFLLRTAFPGAAVRRFRELADMHSSYGHKSPIAERCELAVYAETQAELDQRVAELRVPRVLAEQLVLTDVEAGLALAREERAFWDFESHKMEAARAKGVAALAAWIKERYTLGRTRRATGLCVNIALYLCPRERIDIGTMLQAIRTETAACRTRGGTYYDGEWHNQPPDPFDWVILAGQIGPIGTKGGGPWPIHPGWITDAAAAARAAEVPFCVPHLGEWACCDAREWKDGHTVSGGMSSSDALGGDDDGPPCRSVDYDPTWRWGERKWGPENLGAKPSDAYMQAVGSHMVGRALLGRVFDEWPKNWSAR